MFQQSILKVRCNGFFLMQFGVALLLASFLIQPAVRSQEIQALELGKPIERELAGGQSHSYSFRLEAGQYLHIIVDQRGIDITVTASGPDGKKLAEVDNPNGVQGPESLSLISEKSGRYQINVRSLRKDVAEGRYEIRSEEPRLATKEDHSRVTAQRLMAEASQLSKRNTKEDKEKAVEKYQSAIVYWKAVADVPGEALAFDRIAGILYTMAEYQQALEHFEHAVLLFRSIGDQRAEASALGNMSSSYSNLGMYQKSLDALNRALPISRSFGDVKKEAFILSNIASVYGTVGDREKALDYYSQALALRRIAGDRKGEGRTLINMGVSYTSTGEYQKAFDNFNQALSILRAEKDLQWEGYALMDTGIAYAGLGDYQKAIDYYSKTLDIMQKIGDQRVEGDMYYRLGYVYLNTGEYQRAIDHLNQALSLYRKTDHKSGEGRAFQGVGSVFLKQKDYQKAIYYFNQALSIVQAINRSFGGSGALIGLGRAHNALGRSKEAVNYYNQALLIARSISSPETEAEVLHSIAYAKYNHGDFVNARTDIEAALALVESQRGKVANVELRASYIASVQQYYELYIALLMEQHRRMPSEGFDSIALQANERARARSLIEMLKESRANIRQGVDAELADREHSLQQRLSDKGELLIRLKSNTKIAEQAAVMEKEVKELIAELQQVRTEIRRRSPHYAAFTQPESLSLKEIQQQLLDPDTVLLQYSLGEERSYLWLVTQASINSFELPGRAIIEEAAQKVHEILTARTRCAQGKEQRPMPLAQVSQIESQYQRAAAKLSQMVLGPVAAQLGDKRLLIVCEGVLQSIPFGALPVPIVNEGTAIQPPLITEHEIVSLPSASTLGVMRRELAGRQAAAKTLMIIADPVVDADSLVEYRPAKNVKPASTAKPAVAATGASSASQMVATATGRALRDFGVACAGMSIPPLPFSKQEAKAIEAFTRPQERQVWLGPAANREALLQADLTQYRIIHFATHGLLNSEHPDLSGLVLSLLDENGKEQNGILQLHEIYNLKLNADLVVLSACETAQGKDIRGEGRIGMTRGFMYAGAARVLASLWKVDDEATRDLMKLFYEKLLREKMSPAAALRAAQLEMRRQKRWESPYFWSAFVLQGEYW